MLLDLIRAEGIDGAASSWTSVAASGSSTRSCFATGANRATLADASAASVAVAREAAEAAGLAERMTFVQGDAVRRADDIGRADVVTLDRVICCYRDVESLVRLSAGRAGRLYGIVLPRDRWMVRLAIALESPWFRLSRRPCSRPSTPTRTASSMRWRSPKAWSHWPRPARSSGASPSSDARRPPDDARRRPMSGSGAEAQGSPYLDALPTETMELHPVIALARARIVAAAGELRSVEDGALEGALAVAGRAQRRPLRVL